MSDTVRLPARNCLMCMWPTLRDVSEPCETCGWLNERYVSTSGHDIVARLRAPGVAATNPSIVLGAANEIERLRGLLLLAAVRAADDIADAYEGLETCLRDMVIATGALRRTDAGSEALFKLLDVRARACELLDLDPAGHDWPTES